MAGGVVGDPSSRQLRAGRPKADLDEELVDVPDLVIPGGSTSGIPRLIRQQVAVLAHVRAAATGVDDHRVELLQVEGVQVGTGEATRRRHVPVMGV